MRSCAARWEASSMASVPALLTPRVLVNGPAVEVVSIAGEVRAGPDNTIAAALSGVVADTDGQVFGGFFVPGGNTVCMTFEVTLEEWLPADASA